MELSWGLKICFPIREVYLYWDQTEDVCVVVSME